METCYQKTYFEGGDLTGINREAKPRPQMYFKWVQIRLEYPALG